MSFCFVSALAKSSDAVAASISALAWACASCLIAAIRASSSALALSNAFCVSVVLGVFVTGSGCSPTKVAGVVGAGVTRAGAVKFGVTVVSGLLLLAGRLFPAKMW